MGKINISLPDELIEEIDRRAGDNRSAFVREATAHYITSLDEQKEADARAERIGKAIEMMRSIAPEVGAPDSAKVIRDLRDASPRWDHKR
jgi:metal-responsive CopG/Arc/MetJ family transcriptional regulator